MLSHARLATVLVRAGGNMATAAAKLFEDTRVRVREHEPQYDIGRRLGHGLTADVYRVTRRHDTEPLVPFPSPHGPDTFAMKVMYIKTGPLARPRGDQRRAVENEVQFSLEAESLGVGPPVYDWGLYMYDEPEPAVDDPSRDVYTGHSPGDDDDDARAMVLGYYFIVMQELAVGLDVYLDTHPLTREIIRKTGNLFRTLVDAGIAHGDLGAQNVMIGYDGRLHIIDYGFARSFDDDDALTDPEMLDNARKRYMANNLAYMFGFTIQYDPAWPVGSREKAMALARKMFYADVVPDTDSALG